jgi:hypothetical protein
VKTVRFISTIYRRMWPNGTEESSVDGAASVTSIYIYFHVRYVDSIASDKVVAIESNFMSYPSYASYVDVVGRVAQSV